MKTGWQGYESELAERLSAGAALLGLGALLLLPGPVFGDYLHAWIVGWLAASVHLLAWIVLGWAIVNAYLDRIDTPRRYIMMGAFSASVVSYAGAHLYLALVYPVPWLWGLFYLLWPYDPTVYGPVVIAHSVLFLTSLKSTAASGSSVAVLLGSLYLLALATFALWSVEPGRGVADVRLAGLSSVGYLLVAAGWFFGKRTHVSGAPDEGPLLR